MKTDAHIDAADIHPRQNPAQGEHILHIPEIVARVPHSCTSDGTHCVARR